MMGSDIQRRAIIYFGVLIVAVLFLLPSLFPEAFKDRSWISKPLSLGLDLQGGVYLVYEVIAEEAVKSHLQTIGNTARRDLREKKVPIQRALADDHGRLELVLLSDRTVDQVKAFMEEQFDTLRFEKQESEGGKIKLSFLLGQNEIQNVERSAIERAIETLRNRVDQFGVAEPVIQKVGTRRIILQMPGASDVESVKKIVGSVAKLEFRFRPNSTTRAFAVQIKDRQGESVSVEDEVQMSGEAVSDARVTTGAGQVEVSLVLNKEGARTFRKLTTDGTGRQLSIILDGVEYSSPVIKEPISGGRASISGGFSFEEAKQLAVVLRAGALPAPLKVLEERTIGPSLGKESIRKGVTSILVGFAMIVVFMAVYYKKSGWVANASLLLNVILVLAGLSAFGATLTLPGLAGLALTVGMAVDANVIIFERIRDELRVGAGRDAAIEVGFGKALSAIIDSNITTLLAGLILYHFGTGPIRGFAVTLSIGILTTIYCATFVSKLSFDVFPLRGSNKALSI
ncbi:MAG: protein translocase subunit SecD [Bdellovibrionales bacterium]|nr:protein translocase subunit SecD [Bdellovibrionales bacterium]